VEVEDIRGQRLVWRRIRVPFTVFGGLIVDDLDMKGTRRVLEGIEGGLALMDGINELEKVFRRAGHWKEYFVKL
jgi:hypothetical protein